MRISDWSSDVCSSDLALLLDAILTPGGVNPAFLQAIGDGGPYGTGWPAPRIATGPVRIIKADIVGNGHVRAIVSGDDGRSLKTVDRKRVVSGNSGSVRVDPGGRRLIKNKKNTT